MAIVKYGVIGCGAIGQRRHLPEAHANPKSKVVAVCDVVESRVNQIAGQYQAQPFTDYKKMIKEADIDAVVVGTPNALHAPMSLAAFKAGKHVLVEKPMATTRPDARKMIKAAKDAKKHLMIGLNQRLVPLHIKAKQILKSGVLGKPLTFRTCFAHPGPDGWSIDGAKSWFFDGKLAVMGATGDLGVHKADLMRWLLDQEFVEAGGFISTLDKKRGGKYIDVDDNAYLTLKTNKGVFGSLIASWTNYGRSEGNYTAIYCEKGVLELAMDPQYGVVVRHADGNVDAHKVGAMATNTKQTASGVIDTFTDCIQKNRKPEIDGDEGYKCLNVVLTAMEAAKRGTIMKIKN
jgi:predicted dehydrogenase